MGDKIFEFAETLKKSIPTGVPNFSWPSFVHGTTVDLDANVDHSALRHYMACTCANDQAVIQLREVELDQGRYSDYLRWLREEPVYIIRPLHRRRLTSKKEL